MRKLILATIAAFSLAAGIVPLANAAPAASAHSQSKTSSNTRTSHGNQYFFGGYGG